MGPLDGGVYKFRGSVENALTGGGTEYGSACVLSAFARFCLFCSPACALMCFCFFWRITMVPFGHQAS